MKKSKLLAAALLLGLTGLLQAGEFVLVKDGKSDVKIVCSQTKRFKPYAQALADYIQKSSGAVLPIVPQTAGGKQIKLVIEPKNHSDIEEFSFTFPDKNTLVISGGSENGLKFGVYRFLEMHLGLRRLFPGKLGDHLPENKTIIIPDKAFKDKPAYLSRYLGSGAYKRAPEFYDWSRTLGANNPRVWISHNLYKLLPVEIYGKDHPEYFPEFHGKRVLPVPGQFAYWQPCFTADGIAEVIARHAIEELENNRKRIPAGMEITAADPRLTTVSLGVNDASGFCECAKCMAISGKRKNFVGKPDYSPSYLPMANRIADIVTAKYPQSKLPFLAYNTVSDLPENFGKLNPALIPIVALDSVYLSDPVRLAEYKKVLRNWNASLPEIGTWDYLCTGEYLLPRVYTNMASDYLIWGYKTGLRHYYCQYYPGKDWTSGPKAYLLLKVLWNPAVDREAILRDWYNCCVGEKAAPYLRKYFDNLESFWTKGVHSTKWFQEFRVYASYGSSSYLQAYSQRELDENEALLRKTVELAGSPEQKARAEYFLKLFMDRKDDIQAYWRVQAVRAKAAKLDFSDRLYFANFDPTPRSLSTWQRKGRKAKFFRSENGGVNYTACIGVDTDGAVKGPCTYEARIPVNSKRNFRATVQCRVEGKVDQGTLVSISIYWRDKNGKMLPSSTRVTEYMPVPYDDEWNKLTVYSETPQAGELTMCVGLNVTYSSKGKVHYDDLTIDATPEAIPDEEKFTQVVQDFTFDKVPYNWNKWANNKNVICSRSTNEGRNNSAALMVDCSKAKGNCAGMFNRVIPFRGSGKVLVSAWCRMTANAPANALGRMNVTFLDKNKKPLKSNLRPAVYPQVRDNRWCRLAVWGDAPAGTEFIKIVLAGRRAAPAKVFFDDVTIKVIPKLKGSRTMSVLKVYKAAAVPADGVLPDWQSINYVPLASRRAVFVPSHWRWQYEHFNCKFALAWDKEAFYLAFAVQCRQAPQNRSRISSLWNEDCLEVMIDMRSQPDVDYEGNACHLVIAPPCGDLPGRFFIRDHAEGEERNFKVKTFLTANGWGGTVRLPWSSFPGFTAKVGSEIGLGWHISDAYGRPAGNPFFKTQHLCFGRDRMSFDARRLPRWRLCEKFEASADNDLSSVISVDLPRLLTENKVKLPVRMPEVFRKQAALIQWQCRIADKTFSGEAVPEALELVLPEDVCGAGQVDFTVLDQQRNVLGSMQLDFTRPDMQAIKSLQQQTLEFLKPEVFNKILAGSPEKICAVFGLLNNYETLKRLLFLEKTEQLTGLLEEMRLRIALLNGKKVSTEDPLYQLLQLSADPAAQVTVEYPYIYPALQSGNRCWIKFHAAGIPLAMVNAAKQGDGLDKEARFWYPALYIRQILPTEDRSDLVLYCAIGGKSATFVWLDTGSLEGLKKVDAVVIGENAPEKHVKALKAYAAKHNIPVIAEDAAARGMDVIYAGTPAAGSKFAALAKQCFKHGWTLPGRNDLILNTDDGLHIVIRCISQEGCSLIAQCILEKRAFTREESAKLARLVGNALQQQSALKPVALPDDVQLVAADIHCHTIYSDGVSTPLGVISAAIYSQMDFLMISDHETIDGVMDALKLFKQSNCNFPLLCGEENSLPDGHFNSYPLTENIPYGLKFDDLIRAAHRQGALVQYNHPATYSNRRDLQANGIAGTALEAWEHQLPPHAYSWAELPAQVGSSDSHDTAFPTERTVTLLNKITGESFRDVVRSKNTGVLQTISADFVYAPAKLKGMVITALLDAEKYLNAPRRERLQKYFANANLQGIFRDTQAVTPAELGK